MSKEYALYKGEDLIEIGTVEELAKLTGVKPETILFYSYPSYLERIKEKPKRRVVVLLEDDE